jgi:hypothetical protein
LVYSICPMSFKSFLKVLEKAYTDSETELLNRYTDFVKSKYNLNFNNQELIKEFMGYKNTKVGVEYKLVPESENGICRVEDCKHKVYEDSKLCLSHFRKPPADVIYTDSSDSDTDSDSGTKTEKEIYCSQG